MLLMHKERLQDLTDVRRKIAEISDGSDEKDREQYVSMCKNGQLVVITTADYEAERDYTMETLRRIIANSCLIDIDVLHLFIEVAGPSWKSILQDYLEVDDDVFEGASERMNELYDELDTAGV